MKPRLPYVPRARRPGRRRSSTCSGPRWTCRRPGRSTTSGSGSPASGTSSRPAYPLTAAAIAKFDAAWTELVVHAFDGFDPRPGPAGPGAQPAPRLDARPALRAVPEHLHRSRRGPPGSVRGDHQLSWKANMMTESIVRRRRRRLRRRRADRRTPGPEGRPATVVVEKTELLRRHLGVLRRRLLAARQRRCSSAPASPTRPSRRAPTWRALARSTRTRPRSRRSCADSPELVAELEADDALVFEWLPFPEYYDAPGRVPLGPLDPADEHQARRPAPTRSPRWCGRRSSATGSGRGPANTLSGGQSLIARLLAAFVRDGGTVLTGHCVDELVTDGDRVRRRRRADRRRAGRRIDAGRGVLIAAGGFEHNPEWRARARRTRRRRLVDGTATAPTPASRSRPRSPSAPRPTCSTRAGSAPAWSTPTAAARSRSASAAA